MEVARLQHQQKTRTQNLKSDRIGTYGATSSSSAAVCGPLQSLYSTLLLSIIYICTAVSSASESSAIQPAAATRQQTTVYTFSGSVFSSPWSRLVITNAREPPVLGGPGGKLPPVAPPLGFAASAASGQLVRISDRESRGCSS
ncbi:hypothetical protein QAD02_017232 [Eretmocerus hayati]|uniref:Uncharacterized protein n=1 Tax=Eretmocerus hayati TaxID=131215 RepID=A0ACC2PCU3_9HYME|nr:hypothetical protein QAD02_017232 [Eretmocerus hayati]